MLAVWYFEMTEREREKKRSILLFMRVRFNRRIILSSLRVKRMCLKKKKKPRRMNLQSHARSVSY